MRRERRERRRKWRKRRGEQRRMKERREIMEGEKERESFSTLLQCYG